MFFDLNDNALSLAFICVYYCFFSFDFKRILNAFLPRLNRDQSFALTRFNSFRLKRLLASIHAVLIIIDLTGFNIFA